tara:strand:+ start:1687 stop:2052 length:366 start_codon:yes stop_codon:yes gene_type:complete
MKLSFRNRTSYSITAVGEPCTIDSKDFVNAVPPYKGETEEDFWNYINDNLSDWEAEQYLEDNEGILSEDLLNTLYSSFVEYPTDVMYDSRNKSEEITMDAGELDEEYTKWNGFNVKYSNDV